MKRYLLGAVLAFITTFAFGQETIVLDQDEVKREIDDITVLIVKNTSRNSEDLDVSVKVGNNSSNDIIFFPKVNNEKEMDALMKNFKLEKNYKSRHGKTIVPCEHLVCNVPLIVSRNEIGNKLVVKGSFKNQQMLTLPYYIAKSIKNNKYEIFNSKSNIAFILEKPSFFDQFKSKIDSLKDEISGKTFCPNKQHKPSKEEETKSYWENKKNDLKEAISEAYEDKKFSPTQNKELQDSLGSIKFNERDCGKHKPVKCTIHKNCICGPDCQKGKHNNKCKCDCYKPPIKQCPHHGASCICKDKCDGPKCQRNPGCKCCKPVKCCDFAGWNAQKVKKSLNDIIKKGSNIKSNDYARARLLEAHAIKHNCPGTQEQKNKIKDIVKDIQENCR